MTLHPEFHDHNMVAQSPKDYDKKMLSPHKILHLWSSSMFSYELLDKNKQVKAVEDMKPDTQQKYKQVIDAIQSSQSIEIPIIGIGMIDGIEIGLGRESIAACDVLGIDTIPVYVRQSQKDEIEVLLASE